MGGDQDAHFKIDLTPRLHAWWRPGVRPPRLPAGAWDRQPAGQQHEDRDDDRRQLAQLLAARMVETPESLTAFEVADRVAVLSFLQCSWAATPQV